MFPQWLCVYLCVCGCFEWGVAIQPLGVGGCYTYIYLYIYIYPWITSSFRGALPSCFYCSDEYTSWQSMSYKAIFHTCSMVAGLSGKRTSYKGCWHYSGYYHLHFWQVRDLINSYFFLKNTQFTLSFIGCSQVIHQCHKGMWDQSGSFFCSISHFITSAVAIVERLAENDVIRATIQWWADRGLYIG